MSTDNLTHHLVPRTAGMTCAYCKVVNADTAQVCTARAEKEGVSLTDLAAANRNDASNSWWGVDLTTKGEH